MCGARRRRESTITRIKHASRTRTSIASGSDQRPTSSSLTSSTRSLSRSKQIKASTLSAHVQQQRVGRLDKVTHQLNLLGPSTPRRARNTSCRKQRFSLSGSTSALSALRVCAAYHSCESRVQVRTILCLCVCAPREGARALNAPNPALRILAPTQLACLLPAAHTHDTTHNTHRRDNSQQKEAWPTIRRAPN
jgi:hypothetical protein